MSDAVNYGYDEQGPVAMKTWTAWTYASIAPLSRMLFDSDDIYMYIRYATEGNTQLGVYDDSSRSPNNLLEKTEQRYFDGNQLGAWQKFVLLSTIAQLNTPRVWCAFYNDDKLYCWKRTYTAGTKLKELVEFPDPFGYAITYEHQYSIYGVGYTKPIGGGSITSLIKSSGLLMCELKELHRELKKRLKERLRGKIPYPYTTVRAPISPRQVAKYGLPKKFPRKGLEIVW